MKKFAALLLALVMALSLAACGNQNTPSTSGSASGSGSAGGEDTKVYNVVYLVNGNLGDKSFFDSAKAGLDQLEADRPHHPAAPSRWAAWTTDQPDLALHPV